jgi:transposase
VEEPQQVQADEEHERVRERVAAVDVAKASGVVCTRVPDEDRPGRRRTHLWTVKATKQAVIELADHLRCQGIEIVTLESTSDYWRIWWVVLEAAGLKVQLVNARHVKNVPGRAKTDPLTELPAGISQVSGRVAAWVTTVTRRDQWRGCAAGPGPAGGAAAWVP